MVLCGTKNGSSMASLEEPFEAPLFLRVLKSLLNITCTLVLKVCGSLILSGSSKSQGHMNDGLEGAFMLPYLAFYLLKSLP